MGAFQVQLQRQTRGREELAAAYLPSLQVLSLSSSESSHSVQATLPSLSAGSHCVHPAGHSIFPVREGERERKRERGGRGG